MGTVSIIVIITIAIALAFDVINGFHDAANSIATVVSTRVLKPQVAVLWAAFFNFVAMFIFSPKVADTVSKIVHIKADDPSYVYVILSGLIGAVLWDLLTWWWGLPTSSSHALIGGFAGAGVAHAGWGALRWDKLGDIVKFIFIAPGLGFGLGFMLMLAVYWTFRRWRPAKVDRRFRKAQLFSAALYSIGHGGNDAQKTMGIIMAVLFAGGILPAETKLSLFNSKTSWIVLSCNAAMGLGTAFGGWRIVRTMGMKLTKLKPVGGFCAETAGAITLFMATHLGIPVSTTHTITGSIVGVGSATTKVSAVKWGIAGRIVWAWLFTIPAAAIVSALCYYASAHFAHLH
ncbi:MAG: pit [Myxococcales bacterium]|nr:pit [Myxococcales bacterium]